MGMKIVYMLLAGVFTFAWFHTGFSAHYAASSGAISAGWLFTTFVALALGAGESGDAAHPGEAIINGLKSFVPSFIALIVAALVARLIYEAGFNEAGFQVSGMLETVSTVAAASVIIVLAMSCLRKAI